MPNPSSRWRVVSPSLAERALSRLFETTAHPHFTGYLCVLHTARESGKQLSLHPDFKNFFERFLRVEGAPLKKPYVQPFDSNKGQRWSPFFNENVAGSYARSSLRPGVAPFLRVVSITGEGPNTSYSFDPDHVTRAFEDLLLGEKMLAASLASFLYRDYGFNPTSENLASVVDAFRNDFGLRNSVPAERSAFDRLFQDDSSMLGEENIFLEAAPVPEGDRALSRSNENVRSLSVAVLGLQEYLPRPGELAPDVGAVQGDSAEISLEVPQEPEDDRPSEGRIVKPFDPTKIRVETQAKTIDNLISRMEHNEIVLQPDFQRADVWQDTARSRLIESILIRIPLPAFYMDATDDEKWIVIDGQQRLSTIRRFVIDKSLRLSNLEFLTELEGSSFDQLPQSLKRRIRETNITVYLVERGTPPEVKFNIFRRINTGGLPLSAQEIRHALNQGKATEILKDLACSEEFLVATTGSVSPLRMADREMVLRFLAFVLHDPKTYSSVEFDSFLSQVMAELNKKGEAELHGLRQRFVVAMVRARELLGKYAFRKRSSLDAPRQPINKALFEAWSVSLDALEEDQMLKLKGRKDSLMRRYVGLNNDPIFLNSVSQGTGDIKKVQLRFKEIGTIVQETLRD
jgi:hypothetical protein